MHYENILRNCKHIMKLCTSFGINTKLSSRSRRYSNYKNKSSSKLFTDSEGSIGLHQEPLTSVKNFTLYDFPNESSASSHSLCNFYSAKAVDLYKSREYFSAIHQFKRSLAYDPSHFESLINLGACYFHLQLLDEAIIIFSKGIRMFPDNFIPYFNKALSEIQLQEYTRTIVTVDNALNTLKDPPEALFKMRTYVMFQSGRVTNILDEIKSKNGFEARKRQSSRKVKIPLSAESTFNRPRTSSMKAHRTVYLYPDSKNTFVQVNESELPKRQHTTSKIRIISSTNSPRSRGKSPVLLSKPPPRSKKESRCTISRAEFEKEEHVRTKVHQIIEPMTVYEPGLIQIDTLDRFQGSLDERETTDSFHTNLKALRRYVEKDLERAEELKEEVKGNEHRFISEYEIKMLIEEFRRPVRCMEKIDKIGMKLTFLQKFPFVMRESLYKCARIENFAAGQVIFNEGDSGDSMFVIIRGSVVIHKRLNEVRNYPVIINSLYDGRQFGDVSVLSTISEEETRKGTCVVTEPSTMFIIPKQDYKRLLFKYLKPELEAKANLLLKVRLFQDIELANLYTLASNIETVHASLGESILQKGEVSKGLYIINKGHVEVVTEGYVGKKKKPSVYGNAKIREKSPRPFYTGNCSVASSPKGKQAEMAENRKRRVFVEDPEGLVKDKILNFILHPTEFFGGKALLDGDVFAGTLIKSVPSKFSFIAKSSSVEMFIISKDHLAFLNTKAELLVKNLLSRSFHIDTPEDVDSQQMDELFKDWQKYKEEIVDDIRMKKYVERNKMDFPFIR